MFTSDVALFLGGIYTEIESLKLDFKPKNNIINDPKCRNYKKRGKKEKKKEREEEEEEEMEMQQADPGRARSRPLHDPGRVRRDLGHAI